MHYTRHVPRFRSIKFVSFSFFAFLVFANFTSFSLTSAAAPTSAATLPAVDLENFIPADIPSSGDVELDKIIFRTGERHGVDPRLIHAVIWQESRYKPAAESHKGARGLMQLMPDTAKRFKCDDPTDRASNVEAGTKYLRWLIKRFDGNVSLALAGYNAGEGNVDKHEGIPPFNETQKYVRVITGRYGKKHHPVLKPEEARLAFRLTPELAAQSAE
ncbi:MAG TPA: lytic transglycosylase domain-containing protein [Pyrinomonadaceae bacterium]|nr:lytic transglycosylase domain-containing protein [Pyrinomonadaceae bacterium]